MLGSACGPLISSAAGDGRLSARVVSNVKTTVTGKVSLSAGGERDAILLVPAKAANSAVPLLVFLHGAGQSAARMLEHILPIDSCGRRIAGSLKSKGYNVILREFDGHHEVPNEVAREALSWVAR
jgi:predicted esterase